ncbi:MAG TPA: hypothetical protein VHN74_02750 [Candidatus Angelobacter sp.]|jgi:hypothetical protein|nr:hypothetical protein [Candidatus Angelobacter sp.]
MRLIENLRNAEGKGRSGLREGLERAREEWTDAERRIRQRMRVYPQKLKKLMIRSNPDIEGEAQSSAAAAAAQPGGVAQRPIVSIHGEDVPETEFGEKRPA